MDRADTWEREGSEVVADCRVFRVLRDQFRRASDGKTGEFFVIDSPDWVNVIAITGDSEVVMIEQFRQGTAELNIELPGGIVDDNETAEQAARRELLEETGYTSDDWTFLGASRPNPAIQSNTMSYFLARNCAKTADAAFDPDESIVTRLVRVHEAEEMIRRGIVTHSLVIAAFHYFRLFEETPASRSAA